MKELSPPNGEVVVPVLPEPPTPVDIPVLPSVRKLSDSMTELLMTVGAEL